MVTICITLMNTSNKHSQDSPATRTMMEWSKPRRDQHKNPEEEDYYSMMEWCKKKELSKAQKKREDALDIGSETIYPSLSSTSSVKEKPVIPSPLQFKSALIKKPDCSFKTQTWSKTRSDPVSKSKSISINKQKSGEGEGEGEDEGEIEEFNSNLAETQYQHKW